jgi:transcriptional regulator with XRE-family HTH domain
MNNPNIFADGSGRMALTREETAKALGVTVSTIDKLAARKLLRPSRATRRPLYSVEEITRFLRETTVDLEAEEDGGRRDSAGCRPLGLSISHI